MIAYELQRAAEIADGVTVGNATTRFRGMIHDSRRVVAGNLYAALPGARVDGHDFVEAAREAGASAALVARRVDSRLAQVVVDDVERAMGALAAEWRAARSAKVVGVTGSNGKTTVKTLLKSVLEGVGRTLATVGNYNNEIGVPLTLAGLDEEHAFAVVEMGAGEPGDIAYLARIAAPDVGVVTNAGPAHLERLGSIEGVAATKGELFEELGSEGTAVINRDDRFHDAWRNRAAPARILTFGCHAEADVRIVERDARAMLETPAGEIPLDLALPGRHNLMNAAAAAACALALDVAPQRIAAGLAAVRDLPGRLRWLRRPAGGTVIDDAYNANPGSVSAGLKVLADRPGRRWLVLGEMAELGGESDAMHRAVGREARGLGIDALFALGPRAGVAAEAFGAGGSRHESAEELLEALRAGFGDDVTCLVKGSRSARMERIVDGLVPREDEPC